MLTAADFYAGFIPERDSFTDTSIEDRLTRDMMPLPSPPPFSQLTARNAKHREINLSGGCADTRDIDRPGRLHLR